MPAAQAAVAATVALEHRARTGRGQHVDLSTQQAVCETALSAILYAPAGLEEVQREAGGVRFGNLMLRTIYPCRDGYMIVTVAFGPMIGPMVQRFLSWMHSDGFCDDEMLNKDWVNFALLLQSGEESIDVIEQLMDNIAGFCLTKTKAEMIERGLQDSLLVCPVNTLGDVLDSPQLAARDFWDDVDGSRLPGRFVLAEGTPAQAARARLPRRVHTTAEVTDEWAHAPSQPSPTETLPEGAPADRPLAGLKVADPGMGRCCPARHQDPRPLGRHGGAGRDAEPTVPAAGRVGPSRRRCPIRRTPSRGIPRTRTRRRSRSTCQSLRPVRSCVIWPPGPTWSSNRSRRARWRPGAWGYEDLRGINPDLVLVSSCVMGQTGPFRDFAGFGNMAASVAGFFDITGWEDRGPAGPYLAYTDYCSPRFTVCALLAALDHRRRTGEGQHLDFSQMEAAVHLLAPAIAEMQASGEMRSRRGNADDEMVPHGVYPTMGDDEWIAIAVEGDEQWRSLAIEMRQEDLADLDSAARRERQAELDEIVTAFTSRQNGPGLTHRLHGAWHRRAPRAEFRRLPQTTRSLPIAVISSGPRTATHAKPSWTQSHTRCPLHTTASVGPAPPTASMRWRSWRICSATTLTASQSWP